MITLKNLIIVNGFMHSIMILLKSWGHRKIREIL